MSGIPWWTTDVGGYGCGESHPTDSPYMRELIVRWYQFGCFSPVFRTHGCRSGPSEPDSEQCRPAQGSCGFNEIWSYGEETQAVLETYVRLRTSLKPYLRALGRKFTARGVPTMRPLASAVRPGLGGLAALLGASTCAGRDGRLRAVPRGGEPEPLTRKPAAAASSGSPRRFHRV